MSFHIAIDGPVAAGKGTVARLVAQRLHLLYIDTGAMYRATALFALTNNIPFTDEGAIVSLLSRSKIEMRNPRGAELDGRLTTVLLNGNDMSWEIRTEAVGNGASKVAALPKVREHLVAIQQKIAENQDVIMEGRDITYKVLPHADIKIYLTANVDARAQRRHFELQTHGQDITLESVTADLLERDSRDMERAIDPLKIAPDAWVLDTTSLSLDEVVDLIVQRSEKIRVS